MLVVEKRCKVCKTVTKNKPLLKRIYESKWFIPHSKDSMFDIAEDYKGAFTYESLLNHVKKHQFIDSQDYQEKMLAFADKKAELGATRKAVRAVDAVQSIIEIGNKKLEDGEISVDTNQLLRASQIKMTHESKQKDQELATIEMVAHFLSGAPNDERIYANVIEVDTPPAPADPTAG